MIRRVFDIAIHQNKQRRIGVLRHSQAQRPVQKDTAAFRGGDAVNAKRFVYQALGVQRVVVFAQFTVPLFNAAVINTAARP